MMNLSPKAVLFTQQCPTTWDVFCGLASVYVAPASPPTALLLDKLPNHKQVCLSKNFPTPHFSSQVQRFFLFPKSISIDTSVSLQSLPSSTERFSSFWNFTLLSISQMVFGQKIYSITLTALSTLPIYWTEQIEKWLHFKCQVLNILNILVNYSQHIM